MSDSRSTSSSGVGFFGLLTVLFIGLKLTGHVSWSWWWVLSPLWGSFLLGLILLTIILACVALTGPFSSVSTRRRRR